MRMPFAAAPAVAGLAIVLFASSLSAKSASPAEPQGSFDAARAGFERPANDAQTSQPTEEGYPEFRRRIGELYAQKKYAEAAALLEQGLDRFPGHVLANTYNLASMRVLMDEKDEAVDALEEGHRRGVFYGMWSFLGDVWEPLRGSARFQAFLDRNGALIADAQRKSEMKLDVRLPEGYDPARKWPLFIALHGGGESLAEFVPSWTSARLRREFIVAYVQSSQVASMTGFHWQDDAVTLKEVGEAYRRVLAGYPVDPERVLVGGFSSGGYGSLIVAFEGALLLRGFVILCPEVPTNLTDAAITAAAGRGLRGTLLTTELDHRVDTQKKLAERWGKLGLEHIISVTPNIGHWYPKDFGDRLDQAIGHILGRAHTTH